MSIVELRQYTLRPRARETLIELFEREFVIGQQAVGITVGARFRDLDDPDHFVCPSVPGRTPASGSARPSHPPGRPGGCDWNP
ncbi:hypothetical protein [Streptomyces sp. ITFR-6]|uniref:hypothetical protein n=1 Tax=Streptomyces sp. ITFR-6 TaxID=3075197 RepID=UPI002889EF35|nr:hypothetical protein [Streptomyces sp. ITFR-6]WNI33278.1 hypothetical protein RLT59_34110 [Streptomyces sp. ITFR-6]